MNYGDIRLKIKGMAKVLVEGTEKEKIEVRKVLPNLSQNQKIWLNDEMGMLEMQRRADKNNYE